MTLGERITSRLEELGISQSELARRAGIAQTTVNSLIKKGRRTSPHILRIARELQTTPAYLIGETDDPKGDGPEALPIDSETRELIELFSAMSAADRRALMHVARSMGSPPPPKPTLHSPKLAYAGPGPTGKS